MEDGARIGERARETVHCLLRHARSTVVLLAPPQVPRPKGRKEKLLLVAWWSAVKLLAASLTGAK